MAVIKPQFLCIGAPKSGTTSLYDILGQHPDIYVPEFKEPHFFDSPENFSKGLDWYLDTYFKGAKEGQMAGEFTPSYLFNTETHQQIKTLLGEDVKLIILLRNPVDRAYSHYLHSKRDAVEDKPFEEALLLEESRMQQLRNGSSYVDRLRFSYSGQSNYLGQLNHLFQFFRKEQVRCYIFETDFVQNREWMVQDIVQFLGVEQCALNVNIKSNVASVARSKALKAFMKKDSMLKRVAKKMVPSLVFRQIIRNKIHARNNKAVAPSKLPDDVRLSIFNNYFKKEVFGLEQLLGKDLSNWK